MTIFNEENRSVHVQQALAQRFPFQFLSSLLLSIPLHRLAAAIQLYSDFPAFFKTMLDIVSRYLITNSWGL